MNYPINNIMKHSLILAVALLCLTGCKQITKNETTPVEKKHSLVAYFSATGTTGAVAELLAQAVDADLFEIQPMELYSDSDLNWRDSQSRSSIEMRDSLSRPILSAMPVDFLQYDTIFIGFPIWWGVAPHIINSFLEAADFAGKNLVLFATSSSSPIEPVIANLRYTYPQYRFEEGRLLNNITPADLSQWVEDLRK